MGLALAWNYGGWRGRHPPTIMATAPRPSWP